MKSKSPAGLRSVSRAVALVFALLSQASTFHLVDTFIAEESALRQRLLKLYARFEVRLLRFFYWLLNRPFVANRWIRKFLYYSLAKFMAERAIASQVMTLAEMEHFITKELPEESAIAVGPCRCRLATGACDHPLETDIVILTGTPLWLDLFGRDYRVISRDEALKIVRECYGLGLVPMLDRHMYFKGSANYFVICNCCACSCLPIIGFKTFKYDGYHYIPSIYVSVVNTGVCEGCGQCVEACAFDSRVVRAGTSRVIDCQGCGQCVRVCPNRANSMVKR